MEESDSFFRRGFTMKKYAINFTRVQQLAHNFNMIDF